MSQAHIRDCDANVHVRTFRRLSLSVTIDYQLPINLVNRQRQLA